MVVESPTTAPDPLLIRKLRHDIRGCMHGIALCTAALETPMDLSERAEFLQDIVNATDQMDQLLVRWAELFPDDEASN